MTGDFDPSPLRNTIGKALGRIPSGVFILTARDERRRVAMLASWVQQAAFEPPAVCVAVAKDREILPVILQTRRLVVCVLGKGDTELVRRFARAPRAGDDPFAGLDLRQAPSGLPIVAGALAWLDCELIEQLDFGGDHQLLVAEVHAGEILRQGQSFMHVRGNGFHY